MLTTIQLSALSVVYNFRIAQITKRPLQKKSEQKPYSLTGLIFDLFQKTHCFDIKENYTGALAAFNYNIGSDYYFRTDVAVGHIDQTIKNIQTVNETESDDILCTFGRNFSIGKKGRLTASGLIGVPTHTILTLQHVPFGSGQFGAGIQLDGLYRFTKQIDFLWGTRYNHFFQGTAYDALENRYTFTIGNIADLLVAFQTNNPLYHGLETGYSARWGFGAHSCPTIPNIDLINYMRNNFYIVYKYTFLGKKVTHRFLLNFAYGFDSKPKLYGYNAYMVWGAWAISF